jgi:hypothetical protein
MTEQGFPWASAELREQLLRDPAAVLKDRGLEVPSDLPLPIVHEFVRVKEAFVTSSHFGVVPVVQIDNYQFSTGVETQQLIRWLGPAPSPGTQYRFKDYGKVRR